MDVTRKFRHDLLSHVQTLEYLIEKQKNPDGELRKYADQLTETYRKIQKGTFCRDEITDAFLMMEKQVCIEKEIPFQIQVSKTCMEWMMPVERIGFLHNLLDNAIEANGRIPEKERKEPVSYTHLDVYKRHSWRECDEKRTEKKDPFLWHPRRCAAAVCRVCEMCIRDSSRRGKRNSRRARQ